MCPDIQRANSTVCVPAPHYVNVTFATNRGMLIMDKVLPGTKEPAAGDASPGSVRSRRIFRVWLAAVQLESSLENTRVTRL